MNVWKIFSIRNFIDQEVEPPVPTIDVTEGAEGDLGNVIAPPPSGDVPLDEYRGSKELNPDQRPLKAFDRTMFSSKEDFDEFLAEVARGGEDIFLPEEQSAPKKRGRPKKSDKGASNELRKDESSEKDGGSEEELDEQGDKIESGEKPSEEVEEFLKKLDITIEDFQALPEKVQERLTADDSPVAEYEQKFTKLQEEHTGLINDVVKLKNDPVIAARLEEKATGKSFVARDLPPVNKREAQQLLSLADSPEEFETAVNELILAKAKDVLTIERGVLERNALKAEREKKAAEVLQAVIQKEPRIGISEKDITKLADESHPEYDKFHGAGSLMEMLKRKRYSPAQIIEKGVDEILEEFGRTKGWDQQAKVNIEKKAKQSLLQNLRNFQKVARTLDSSKRSAPPANPERGGFDKQTLVAEIASGKTGRWSKLITEYGDRGERDMVDQLQKIFDEGMQQKRN